MSTNSKDLEKKNKQRAHTPTDAPIKKIISTEANESLLYVAPQFITTANEDDELFPCFVTGYN